MVNGLPEDQIELGYTLLSISVSIISILHGLAQYTLHKLYDSYDTSIKTTLVYMVANVTQQLTMVFWPLVLFMSYTHSKHFIGLVKNIKDIKINEFETPITTNDIVIVAFIFLSIAFGVLILWFFFFKCLDKEKKFDFTDIIIYLEANKCINFTYFLFPKFKKIKSEEDILVFRRLYSVLVCILSFVEVAISSLTLIAPNSLCAVPIQEFCNGLNVHTKIDRLFSFYITFLVIGVISFILSFVDYLCIRTCEKTIYVWAFNYEIEMNKKPTNQNEEETVEPESNESNIVNYDHVYLNKLDHDQGDKELQDPQHNEVEKNSLKRSYSTL